MLTPGHRHTKTGTDTERGATAIIIAVALLLLLGFASLAIDASLGFDDRRGTQNAADLAALAAAYEECNPVSGAANPVGAANQTAADNGYDNAAADTQLIVTDTGTRRWTVQITNVNQASFGQATPFAPDQLDIVSEATATCVPVGISDGFAVFGQGECGDTVHASGANITINGGVHSNEDLHLNNAFVDGVATYRGNDQAGSVVATQYFGSPVPYPITLAIAEYAPGGSRAVAAGANYFNLSGADITRPVMVAAGHGTFNTPWLEISQPGVYYTDEDVDFNRVRLVGQAAVQGVTFAAGKTISFTQMESLKGYDPYAGPNGPKVSLFADGSGSPSCSANDIKIAGSGTWEGIMFAPNGAIEISGSDTKTVLGSLIAYNIKTTGAAITITYQDDPDADPRFRVELVD